MCLPRISYFEQDKVFPIIARAIDDHSTRSSSYMVHEDIVTAFWEDPEGSRLVDWARERAKFEGDRRSKDWTRDDWAANMVAWFSHKIVTAGSSWRSRFEGKKIKGKWAYRVRSGPSSPP